MNARTSESLLKKRRKPRIREYTPPSPPPVPEAESEEDEEVKLPDPLLAHGEYLRRKFKRFAKAAWHIIEPGTDLKWNWHHDVLCDHLQAVTEGKIKNLIINIPPRCSKSTFVSVLWPAWEWAQIVDVEKVMSGQAGPHLEYLTGSYDTELATRDALASRNLIQSKWYQERFGHCFKLKGDQNQKTRYENNKGGHRIITSPGSGTTGEGGHRKIIDDAHEATKAMYSEPERLKAINWFDNSMISRDNDPENTATVVIGQRVAVNDITGHILSKMAEAGEPVEHIRLPMEYDGIRRKSILGYYDPRRKKGELLWPQHITQRRVKLLKRFYGSYGTACQLQQEPIPLGGVIFKQTEFQYYKQVPTDLEEIALTVDCSFKDLQSSDYVAIQAWGRREQEKFLLKRFKDRLDFGATVKLIELWSSMFPSASAVLVEDKANGTAVINTLKRKVSGLVAVEPQGGKLARGYACQPQMEAGQVWLPDPSVSPDIVEYLEEVCAVPGAPNDDEFDATTQILTWFQLRQGGTGVFEFYRKLAKTHGEEEKRLREQAPDTPEQFAKSSQQLWQEEQDRKKREQGNFVFTKVSPWQVGKAGRKAA